MTIQYTRDSRLILRVFSTLKSPCSSRTNPLFTSLMKRMRIISTCNRSTVTIRANTRLTVIYLALQRDRRLETSQQSSTTSSLLPMSFTPEPCFYRDKSEQTNLSRETEHTCPSFLDLFRLLSDSLPILNYQQNKSLVISSQSDCGLKFARFWGIAL